MQSWQKPGALQRGFTLVELLVVLLIFAILMAIAVPSLISSQPQRNLAAAGDRFAQDFNYARAKAEGTKNRVFIAFETTPDLQQVEGYFANGASTASIAPTASGAAYLNPSNPGVARVARSYVVVEERPRFKNNLAGAVLASKGTDAQGEKFTYLDWLNTYDQWDASDNIPPYPVEPIFPFSVIDTAALGPGLDPKLGAFNAVAAPLVVYPQDIAYLGSSSDYPARHLNTVRAGGVNWSAGNDNDQQFKVFCTDDEASILAMDDASTGADGLRFYDSSVDNPRLQDQVVDYVLLKRVTLPEHCVFVNPWKDSWVVAWDDVDDDGAYAAGTDAQIRQDMQFLQYLWVFEPPGRGSTFGGVKLGLWTYDPEVDSSGTLFAAQYHGKIQVVDDLAAARSMFMVLDEVLETESTANYPATAGNPAGFGAATSVLGGANPGNKQANKKTNLSSAGREFTFWTMGSKYYVDEYTPNDVGQEISETDPRLNSDYVINGGGNQDIATPSVAREFGYRRNFLVPGTQP